MFDTKNSFLPLLAKKNIVNTKSRGRVSILQVIRNANMALMFDGLIDHAKKSGIRVEELDYGQAVLFVNREGKYIKMLIGTKSRHPVIACYRFPPGMRFPLDAVRDIAKSFKGNEEISAVDKLKRGLEMFYAKKSRGKAGRLSGQNTDKHQEEARVSKAREVSPPNGG
jgi:hypothetical protein